MSNKAVGSGEEIRPIDIAAMVRVVWRRSPLIAVTVIAIMTVAYWIVGNLAPRYDSSALVLLDVRRANIFKTENILTSLTLDLTVTQTEIEVLRSPRTLSRIVDRLNLAHDPEFNPRLHPVAEFPSLAWLRAKLLGAGPPPEPPAVTEEDRLVALDALSDRLTVLPRGRSYVIGITASTGSAVRSATIANALATLYVDDQLEAKRVAVRRASELIIARLDELKRRVEEADLRIASYRQKNNLIETRDSTIASQQLNEIITQLTLARTERSEKEARLKQVRDTLRDPRRVDSVSEVLSSPLIQRLREQESDLNRREAELAQRYGELHPRMQQVRAEREELRLKITTEADKIVRALAGELEISRSRENGLAQARAQIEKQATDANRATVDLRQLQREADATRQLYETMLNRSKETEELELVQEADARLVSPAEPATSASYPRPGRLLAAASVVALAIALGLVFVVERMDRTLRRPEDLDAVLGIPCVALLPPARPGSRKPSLTGPFRERLYWEQLRSVRAAFEASGENPRTLLVTSSFRGEDAPAIARDLAAVVAAGVRGTRVLLLECDFRHPDPAGTGATLHALLSGQASLDEAILLDGETGIARIRAAERPLAAPELLGSAEMRELLDLLVTRYDLVILSGAPILGIADSAILAEFADAVLLAVSWGKTARGDAGQARQILMKTGKPVLGVLSRVALRRYGFYGDTGTLKRALAS